MHSLNHRLSPKGISNHHDEYDFEDDDNDSARDSDDSDEGNAG